MPDTQFTTGCFSLISDKPFNAVLAAIKYGVRNPELNTIWAAIWGAKSFQRIEPIARPVSLSSQPVRLEDFDAVGCIRLSRGEDERRSMLLLIGDFLLMKQMTELTPDATDYVPATMLVGERQNNVHLSYDRGSGCLSAYDNPGISKIANVLDSKIETMMRTAV